MNLEYAAYLLNENYLLAEDADSDGIKYAKKWVTKNFNLTDFGQNATDPVLDDEGNPVVVNQQTQDDQGNPTTVQRNVPNVEDIVENARKYFGYWMSKQMNLPEHVRLGILKFLPGAIRIAINDCGWNTPHKNLRMLENLRYLYTAAYLEWRDGIAEGRPGPQRGQQYAGKYNRDLQPLKAKLIFLTFFVFHFEISGIVFNEIQPLKIPFIVVTLYIFHFKISGKVFNKLQFTNKKVKSSTLQVFHLVILGNSIKELQPLNMD